MNRLTLDFLARQLLQAMVMRLRLRTGSTGSSDMALWTVELDEV